MLLARTNIEADMRAKWHAMTPFTRARVRMNYLHVSDDDQGPLYRHCWCIEFTNNESDEALWLEPKTEAYAEKHGLDSEWREIPAWHLPFPFSF